MTTGNGQHNLNRDALSLWRAFQIHNENIKRK